MKSTPSLLAPCLALLVLLGSGCAATSGASSKNSNRGRSGQIGASDFLASGWGSSGINSDAGADQLCAVTVVAFDATSGTDTYDMGMMSYLESELGGLGRFPVQSLTSSQETSMMRDLHQLGEVDLPDGTRAKAERRYAIVFRYIRGEKHFYPKDIPALRPTSNAVHKYWLEGDLKVLEVTTNPADDRILYADRTFRTTPNYKYSAMSGDRIVGGHDPAQQELRDMVYRDLRQDVLFRLSKEIYTKLCVEGRVTTAYDGGGSVQLGTDLTSRYGVFKGQMMFVYADLGGIRVPVAKAVAMGKNGDLEVLQWRANDREADEFRRDPEAYVRRADRRVIVQSEKLAVSDEDSERLQELERLSSSTVRDNAWFSKMSPAAREAVERAVSVD